MNEYNQQCNANTQNKGFGDNLLKSIQGRVDVKSARFVGSIPEHYDQGLGPHIFEGYADDLASRVAELNPRSVLELAAGTGIVSRKLRDHLGNDCELVASDLNEPMLDVAKSKFEAGDSVRFEQIDAMAIPYADSTFDVLTCQFGVMFFPDKARSYQEAQRVLKPGGSYLFNVWGSWESNPFARVVHETVEQFFPDSPPGFYRVPFGYHDAEEIRGSLREAGFSGVTAVHVPLTSTIRSAEGFSRGLIFGNPIYDEVVERGGDPEAICAAVCEAIGTHLGSEMPLQALVVCASKAG